MESHLEEYRRRDSNETSTLAKAMEQIENNLKSAMVAIILHFLKIFLSISASIELLIQERALSSENQVVQLKKENRILQVLQDFLLK